MSAVRRPSRRWSYGAGLASTVLLAAVLLSRAGCAPAPSAPLRSAAAIDSAAPSARAETTAPPPAIAAIATEPPQRGATTTTQPEAADPDPPLSASGGPAQRAAANPSVQHGRAVSVPGAPSIDPRELRLLASIERELKRNPPPEVHALIAEHRRGADRDALITHVQTQFPPDLALRVLTLRWIDDVHPGTGGAAATRPKTPALGTGPGWVKPVEQR